jgi:exopolyphosphatase/guanosine-5'-triphosphate,3'-diphosphate pyrophosphatase
VRLTERHVSRDPPAGVELDRIRADVRAALACAPSAPAGGTLVGTAGTVTSLLAIELGLLEYDARRIHGAALPLATVRRLRGRLSAMRLAERRQLAGLDPNRADVIVAGALIVEETLQWARANELVVSDRGLRWGLIGRAVAQSGPAR